MNNHFEFSVKALIALCGFLASATAAGFSAVMLARLYFSGGLTAEAGQILSGAMMVGSFLAILSSMYLIINAPRQITANGPKSNV